MANPTSDSSGKGRIPPAAWVFLVPFFSTIVISIVFREEIEERELRGVMKAAIWSAPMAALVVWLAWTSYGELRKENAEKGFSESRLLTAKKILQATFLLFGLPILMLSPMLIFPGAPTAVRIASMAALALVVQLIRPRLLLRFTDLERVDDTDLDARMELLARQARVSLGSVLVIPADEDDPEPLLNAGVHGIGKSRQMILSADLISHLEPDQLDAIVAHELGHLRESHLTWQIVVLAVGQISLYSLSSTGSVFGQVAFVFVLLGYLPAHYGFSRWCEYRADRRAAQWTNPMAAAEALRVITREEKRPKWWARIFSTHPDPQERIARLLKMA
ncbi:MAG: hypothetical protein CMJ89_11145 [Planctomycetes bacterium]|nr:hypothetical protein [Planctomycetota bacterium]